MTRSCPVLAAVILATALVPTRAGARTFQDIIGRQTLLAPVGQAFADTVGQALPITAASRGVTFRFDKETHAFERETDIFGQLYLERPQPIGRGQWSVNLSYEWIRFDTIGGETLSELADTGPPILDPPSGALFTLPRFHMGLEVNQVTAGATYGVTDDIDINLAIPLVTTTFSFDGAVRVLGGLGQPAESSHATKAGIGDVRLRAKYRFARRPWGELAAGLVLRLPTGYEENFQGSGIFQVGPELHAATRPFVPHPVVRLQGYANLGLDLATTDVGRSSGRYGIGLDCGLAERLTLAIGFLGREPFEGIASPGAFDVVRVDPESGRRFLAPVLGLSTERANVYQLSFGGRVALWRGSVFGFANVLVQLNDHGLSTAPIPLVGVEATF